MRHARLGLAVGAIALAASACGDDTSTDGTTASSGTSSSTGAGAGGGGATGTGGGGGAGTGGSAGPAFTSVGASTYEAQTAIAADAGGNIVVVWRATFVNTDSTSVGYAASHDGGASWSTPTTLDAPGGRLAINPVVVADGAGQITLAFIGNRLTGDPDQHVYVSRFDAGTDTFGTPVNASDDGSSTTRVFDALSIAVDANDDVLLTWADFSAPNAELTFARSTNGTTFARSTIVNDATFGNLAHVCVDTSDASAPLFVVHLGASGTLTLRRSDDGGATWDPGPTLSAAEVVFQSPTCASSGDDLVLAYGAGSALFSSMYEAPADRIEALVSTNGGASFGAPRTVAPEAGIQYLYPRLVRAPNGHLDVTYYEGIVGQDATFSHASSVDGVVWTQAPIFPTGTFTIDRSLASWLGAYTGVVVPGATGFASYTENTMGKTHVGFVEFALP